MSPGHSMNISRDALIEAGTQAVCDWDPDYDPADEGTRAAVGVVVDAVEPKIRADERVKTLFTASAVHRDEWATFRAQVEALWAVDPYNEPVREAYDAVLALLDGGSA